MVKLGIYGTVYNSADTVRTTIEDLKKKLKYDFVISVCDNFSKDGTFEILKEYDFIDAFQRKSTRGLGRQYALENLIKNHPDVDYIFYIDFDVIFPDYLNELIKGIIKIYKENEIIKGTNGFGDFGSINTYKKILTKVRWRDMNVIEDFMHDIDVIRKGFELYFLWLPTAINQERPGRERKYAKGLKYFNRLFKIYFRDFLLHNFLSVRIKFNTIKSLNKILNEYIKDIITPPELGLDKKLLFFIISYDKKYFHKILLKLTKYYEYIYIYKLKRKVRAGYYMIIYYDYNTVEKYIINLLKYGNRSFNEGNIIEYNLK